MLRSGSWTFRSSRSPPRPAIAATYSAKLAIPTSERFIARDIIWNCGPAACQGATDESRPVVLCQSLAKRGWPHRQLPRRWPRACRRRARQCNASAKAANSGAALAAK